VSSAVEERCCACDAAFTCDVAGSCWCAELPNVLPIAESTAQSCLCPTCLREKIAARAAADLAE